MGNMIRSFEQGQTITIYAPAKVNLFLKVLARRPDGYHEIDTVMVKLQLADLVTIKKRGKNIRLSCPGSSLPEDASNLAYRAASNFFHDQGVSVGVDIVLEKKIPVAAGLGGGSSDAAAVLRGLNLLFETKLNEEKLVVLARELGADVPFFVTDFIAARGSGIGDRLRKFDLPTDFWCVLVNPGFAVSTKWVYEKFALTTGGNPYILGRKFTHGKKQDSLLAKDDFELFNDLESVTIDRYPEIDEIKRELLEGGARDVLMSGSGPTVFGLYKDKDDADGSYSKFVKLYSDVFVTRVHQS